MCSPTLTPTPPTTPLITPDPTYSYEPEEVPLVIVDPTPSPSPDPTTTTTTVDTQTDEEGNIISTTTTTTVLREDGSTVVTERTEFATGGSEEKRTEVFANGNSTKYEKKTEANGDYTKTAITIVNDKPKLLVTTKQKGTALQVCTYNVNAKKELQLVSVGSSTKSETITIPKTIVSDGVTYRVTTVAKAAFKNRRKLTKLTIGKNIKKIGADAFRNDSNLKSVVIKSVSITSIGKNAFKGIAKKATIWIEGTKKQVKKITKLIKKSGIGKKVKIKKKNPS